MSCPGADAIRLIDVLWIDEANQSVAAFEVEHTTSIYSGIVRMLDLALSGDSLHATAGLFWSHLTREGDVRAQLQRPAFSRIGDLDIAYLPYGELARHRDAIALRLGSRGSRLSPARSVGPDQKLVKMWCLRMEGLR
jgi:type II restriction enzyme